MNIPLLIQWRQRLQPNIAYNDVPGVTITGQNTLFEIALLHHLTPEENQGSRNIYVDIVDAQGHLLRGLPLRIGWTWEGRRADEAAPPYALDKPANEPAGNVPLFMDAKTAVWLQTADGHVASERVHWLSSKRQDGVTGNTMGHNSYYIIFRERDLSAVRPVDPKPVDPVVVEPMPALVELQALVTAIEANIQALKRSVGLV